MFVVYSIVFIHPLTNQPLLRYDSYLSEADKSVSPSSQSDSQANRISVVSILGMGLLTWQMTLILMTTPRTKLNRDEGG